MTESAAKEDGRSYCIKPFSSKENLVFCSCLCLLPLILYMFLVQGPQTHLAPGEAHVVFLHLNVKRVHDSGILSVFQDYIQSCNEMKASLLAFVRSVLHWNRTPVANEALLLEKEVRRLTTRLLIKMFPFWYCCSVSKPQHSKS